MTAAVGETFGVSANPATDRLVHRRSTLLDTIAARTQDVFRPIVNAYSGTLHGVEAILAGDDVAIEQWRNEAAALGCTLEVETILQNRALARFATEGRELGAKLFIELDHRLIADPRFRPAAFMESAHRLGVASSQLCLALSEAQTALDADRVQGIFRNGQAVPSISISNFGAGHSGLRLLQQSRPEYVKLDGTLITGIEADQAKRVFLSAIVNLSHVLGVPVIADGIETQAAFWICCEIGCEMVQGPFIAEATADLSRLPSRFNSVSAANRANRRDRSDWIPRLRQELDMVAPLVSTAPMEEVLQAFRADPARVFFPVIDPQGLPCGLLQERDLKSFVFSPYGREILTNTATRVKLDKFLSPCLTADINTPIDRLVGAFARHDHNAAIVIVENGGYLGMLPANALIRLMNERSLIKAQNENPLTGLPGNATIDAYIADACAAADWTWHLAYFDLNYFKPFNDHFGFRQGDRAILMFADLLRTRLKDADVFIGHIGGDDFFAGMRDGDPAVIRTRILALIAKFGADVASFYDVETRRAGFMAGLNRDGEPTRFPLLSVSCALLTLPVGSRERGLDAIGAMLAELKKQAKQAPDGLAAEDLR
jgi:EAL domain-containing protein (putative c-di-GMP-specific phosphodiesterase class I)/GGDEF domain-containing protein